MVVVPKKGWQDQCVCVCVDYRDLNKASPKDNFLLPHIDILVYNAAKKCHIFIYGWVLGI
jgi:hypothetical protein